MKTLKTIALAGILGVAAFATGTVAEAGSGCSGYSHATYRAPSYSLKKVVTYKYAKQAYRKRCVSYDHCGDIVVTYKIAYRTVKVPVVSYVKVWY